MKISNECLKLVKKWEGFYENAYLCPAKVWTIGFGTTVWPGGVKVKKGDKISRAEADKLLEKQVNEHASTINSYVKIELNQNQYDALASFQYNLGRHILKGSYLLNYLNNKQWDKAANSMMQYNKARVNGKLEVLRGLTNRRTEEVALFLKPINKSVEDEDMKFANDDLKAVYKIRNESKATKELLTTVASKELNINKKVLDEGDMAAIAYELAVYFSKKHK